LRASSGTPVVLAMTAVLVIESGVSAHRRDELLQAARIAIEPSEVELGLDLTPGIAVADAIIADIDRNRDGSLSAGEKDDYARWVLAAIELDVDGQPLQLTRVASTFPDLDTVRRGEGTIQLRSAATLPRVSDGDHQLSFRNTHRRDLSVYLANALVPRSDRIAITAQQREAEQRNLTIDYVVRGSTSLASVSLLTGIAGAVAALLMWRFARWTHPNG
jgi:hypothetical protein